MAQRQVNLCAFGAVQSWIVDLVVKYERPGDKMALETNAYKRKSAEQGTESVQRLGRS